MQGGLIHLAHEMKNQVLRSTGIPKKRIKYTGEVLVSVRRRPEQRREMLSPTYTTRLDQLWTVE